MRREQPQTIFTRTEVALMIALVETIDPSRFDSAHDADVLAVIYKCKAFQRSDEIQFAVR